MNHPVRYFHLEPGTTLPPIPTIAPFRAVIITEQSVSDQWMSLVSNWLVESGCLFAMAWGNQASDWDNAVDMVNLQKKKFNEIPGEKLVMTTWHDKEPLGEVFWFSKNNAFHPKVELPGTLLLHISPTPAESDILQKFESA